MTWRDLNPPGDGAPDYWPIIQVVSPEGGGAPLLWTESRLHPTKWAERSAAFSQGKTVRGWGVESAIAVLICQRARWEGERGAVRPWGPHPGDGWRSSVQLAIALPPWNGIAIVSLRGVAGQTALTWATAVRTCAIKCAQEVGRPWPTYALKAPMVADRTVHGAGRDAYTIHGIATPTELEPDAAAFAGAEAAAFANTYRDQYLSLRDWRMSWE